MELNNSDRPLIWIRGAGDIATGVGIRLLNANFRLIFSEIEKPTAIRRTVAFGTAVYEGSVTVEGYTSICCRNFEEVERALLSNHIPIFLGDERAGIKRFKPTIFLEGTIRKNRVSIPRDVVPNTLALGPGFSAPKDVDAVIETMRGHYLGQVIWQGSAIPNTGIPGDIAGYTHERVIHTPVEGRISNLNHIGDYVEAGDSIAVIDNEGNGEKIHVKTTISGILRGIIYEGLWVEEGMKIADVDPRCEREHCFTVSDKARAIGGGVLEAIMHYIQAKT